MFQLQKIREERGLSRTQLSLKIGIHPATYGKVESGKWPAYPKYRRLLAAALDVPEDELFQEVQTND